MSIVPLGLRLSMTISLTEAELTDLCEQNQIELPRHESGFRQSSTLPKSLGDGVRTSFHLRGGLILEIMEGQLRQTLQVRQVHEARFPLTAKFLLSGSSWVQTPGIREIHPYYIEQQGFSYLYHLPSLEEIEEWSADEVIQIVTICADLDSFRAIGQEQCLPTPLYKSLQGQRFHESLGPISSAMREILQQILHCPYRGSTQALYLESKALELFALQLEYWERPASPQLPADDVERLHHAREVLIRNAKNPPLLLELAHQVGLNDRKLKQGFRQLFGTTVFGYLQNYRMGQAKQLLEDDRLSVAAIATSVGYRNPEAFSTAFRRKFSISPKAYQLSQRV